MMAQDSTTERKSSRGLVSPEELNRWRYPNLWRSFVEMAGVWLQAACGIALYYYFPNPLSFILAIVVVGAAQHGLNLVAHEFAHYSAIPQNKKLNDFIGTWFFAAPVLLPLPLFRERHFAHHRHYSEEEDDTKIMYRRDIRGIKIVIEVVRCLSGYEFFDRLIRAKATDRPSKNRQFTLLEVSIPVVLSQLLLLGFFSWLDGPWMYVSLWLLPLVTISMLLYKIRALMEHQPPIHLDTGKNTGYFRNTADRFVRTVTATPFERFFLSHINFCYHAEHHLWPQVSYQHLPKLRKRLEESNAFEKDARIHQDADYRTTIRSLWEQ